MAVKRIKQRFAYGLGDNLLQMGPLPILAQRAPTSSDIAEIGTTWIDESAGAHYVITRVVAGVSTWEGSSSGTGTFSAVTANPGDITATDGDIVATLGNLNIASGNATIGGDLTVTGALSFSGDFDLSSAALIDLISTLNSAPSILLHANGGAAEQVYLHSDQGTTVDSILLGSDVGGLTLLAGLASNDAINITASSGGVDIDAALQISITSSENVADAIVINASAGGLDIISAGAAGEDLDITNTSGSLTLTSGEVIADSMVFTSAGGLDFVIAGTGSLDIDMVNTAGSVNIESAEAVADSIVLNASDGAGGVIIQAGTGGILVGNEGDTTPISIGDIAPTASRTITVGGGIVAIAATTDTIDIGPDGATTNANSIKTVNIGSGDVTLGENNINIGTGNRISGTHLVALSTGTGTKIFNVGNADGLTTVNIDAITLINDSIDVATSINAGTSTGTVSIGNGAAGAVTIDSGAGISFDGAAASNFSTSGAGIDLTLDSDAGSVVIAGGEAILTAVTIIASDAAGGIDMDSGTTGTILDSTGPISLDAAADSNFSVTGAGIDLRLASAVGRVVIDGGEAAVDSVDIVASDVAGGIDIDSGTGGITIDSTGALSLDAEAASNFSTTGAGIDLTLESAAGRVIVNAGEDAADAILLHINNGGSETIHLRSQLGTGVDSINLSSDIGGLTFSSGLASADAINVSASAGGVDIDGALQVNITSSQAAASAIVLNASNGAGGIDFETGGGSVDVNSQGLFTSEAGTATDATGPAATAAVTINTNIGLATLANFTTAAAATLVLTLTNSIITAGSGIFVSCSTLGANDAQMTVTRKEPGAGTCDITLTNNGAAAVNGNILVEFWVFVA